jgi:adenylosuccinate synthase
MGKHKVVVGLGFGDEGKGTIVDYLTSLEPYDFVLRFSGGAQAAHNVVRPDGTHHTFSQFGAGHFNGTKTILTKYMMVNPVNMINEGEALEEITGEDPFNSILISENALLITPWAVAYNQLEEMRRGAGAHGSCGQGIGITQKFSLDYPDLALRVGDLLLDRDSFTAKAMLVQELLKAEYGKPTKEHFMKMDGYVRTDLHRTPGNVHGLFTYNFLDYKKPLIVTDEEILELVKDSNCVWEGSQGVLLDEWKGFHPYTTWSTTTSQNALQLLSEAGVPREDVEVVGVTRTYHTRHGAGPFPTEDSKLLPELPEAHNAAGVFQGAWRVGALDLSLLYYGIAADGEIDSLAVTHLDLDKFFVTDRVYEHIKFQMGSLEEQEKITKYLSSLPLPFRWEFTDFGSMLQLLVKETQIPISVMSLGPCTDQKMQGGVGVNWYLVDTASETMVE